MVRLVTFCAMTAGTFMFLQAVNVLRIRRAYQEDERLAKEREEKEIAKTREKILQELGLK